MKKYVNKYGVEVTEYDRELSQKEIKALFVAERKARKGKKV